MQLLDGKTVSEDVYNRLKGEVAALKEKDIHPKLVIILVGDDPGSLSYIRSKRKASEKVGVISDVLTYKPDEIDTQKLIAKIEELNADRTVHGILVQLPLPAHIYTPEILKAIDPKKDVDGFTAYNLGKMFISREFEDLVPCTPLGVIRMLEFYKIPLEGKNAVVVGASNLVGKPMATMLINRRATVTVCNSRTADLASHTKKADILVVAVGKIGLITEDMVKEGAVVVDVGINRRADGKLTGDVDFESVSKKASFITPVPGGAGLMTVACLMENVFKATVRQTTGPKSKQ
jgi:methylenetetrahydrofolate dehydrogenase (NADP+)/methenyltetrahydrofolate cyclohydrolase